MANVVLSWLSSEHFHVVLMLVLMLTADVFPQTLRQLLLPSDGSPLCAVEAPSFIVSIPAFWTYQVTSSVNTQVPSCVPDTLKCAWICKQDRNCTSFNYNQTLLQCELYYYRPLNYAPSQDCQHYWTETFDGTCPDSKDFGSQSIALVPAECCGYPFTFDGQLYTGGCAQNASDLGCFVVNRQWASCLPPADYGVLYAVENMTFPTESTAVQVLVVNGWIVFHQKVSNSLDYNITFAEYKAGFGDVQSNLWLGLERVYQLTSSNATYRMRIEMQLQYNLKWYSVEYDSFSIDSEANGYAIHVSGCTGDACDPFDSPVNDTKQNNMKFSTWDRNNNNDIVGRGNCGQLAGSGFWYNYCSYISLTSSISHRCYSIPPVDGNQTTHNLIISRMMMKRYP